MKKEYVIEGSRINSRDDFYIEISKAVTPGAEWGRNLDAFNDVLRGSFGTPENGFVIHWKDPDHSRQKLGGADFAELIEIIRIHGPGGEEESDDVRLILG